VLTRTYNAARLFDIRHLCLTLRAAQHTALLYIYQLITVCGVRHNSTVVFVGFSDGAAQWFSVCPTSSCIPKAAPYFATMVVDRK